MDKPVANNQILIDNVRQVNVIRIICKTLLRFKSLFKKRWSIELEETNFESNIRSIELTISSVISCIGKQIL